MRSFQSFLAEGLTPVPNTQYGSNEGGVYRDEDGKKFYVKHYDDPEQGRVEALTGKIYSHMGIKNLGPEVKSVGGKEAVVTPWNDSLESMHHSEFEHLTPSQRKDIGRIYHGAVLTKNWDVVGLTHDNLMRNRDTGDIHSVDHGGSFHYRARGGPKEYGPDVKELQSLRYNSDASGHVFHHVLSSDPEAYRAGHEAVKNMDMDHVHRLFQESGLKNADELHRNFVERRNKLLSAPHP